MRCQKIRSLLSAYCNDELVGHKQLKIREHLSVCPACRKEESVYRSLAQASKVTPQLSTTSDFNARLLERIAQERFAETRTKAYMPKAAPLVQWRHVVPALSMVAAVLLVAFVWLPSGQLTPGSANMQYSQNDDYITAQPVNNPNMTANLRHNWSLDGQMAQTERFSRLSNSLTNMNGFGNLYLTTALSRQSREMCPRLPHGIVFYRIKPVIRSYNQPGETNVKEDQRVY